MTEGTYPHLIEDHVELALQHLAFVALEMKEVSYRLAAAAREDKVIPQVLEYIHDSVAECHKAGEALTRLQDRIKKPKWESLTWAGRVHREPRRYLVGTETVQGGVLPPSTGELQAAHDLRDAGKITEEEFRERTRVQRSSARVQNRYSESPSLPHTPLTPLPAREGWREPQRLGCGLCGGLTCRGGCFK